MVDGQTDYVKRLDCSVFIFSLISIHNCLFDRLTHEQKCCKIIEYLRYFTISMLDAGYKESKTRTLHLHLSSTKFDKNRVTANKM